MTWFDIVQISSRSSLIYSFRQSSSLKVDVNLSFMINISNFKASIPNRGISIFKLSKKEYVEINLPLTEAKFSWLNQTKYVHFF